MNEFENFIYYLITFNFTEDRSWNSVGERGENFRSFRNGNLRIEIKIDWDKVYDSYPKIMITLLDCSKEFYNDGSKATLFSFIGWMGQKEIITFYEIPPTTLIKELLNYYGRI